ncbi:MAG: thiamine pyrophosphate-dependent dehydrogenase E1 component subunit alpha [Rhodospirillaceae bacterium]
MSTDTQLELLRRIKRIRHVEEEIARRYPEGKMRCPTHLSIGQEGVAAAVGLALSKDDLAVSGHRAHAHYLGKGGNLEAMLAEIYGKASGCCGGKGGSMHLIDEDVGFMGSTAIVAGTVPVGVGLAYGIKFKKLKQVSCVFHGDAVVEAGVFFESVNFAVLKNLPVLFVCENNLYSVYSPLSVRQPSERSIADMVKGLGISSQSGDGNDASAVYQMTLDAVGKIRAGQGPQFLEFSTYRWREHCGPFYDNDIGYRTEEEFNEWKAKDPLTRLRATLEENGTLDSSIEDKIDKEIHLEVEAAFQFAEDSDFPEASAAYTDLYAPAITDGASA